MTMLTLAAIVAASMAAQDQLTAVRTAPVTDPPVIEIAAHLVRASDRATITAGRAAPYGGRLFVWTENGCTAMVGDREPEKVPAAGWRITALVRGAAGEAVDLDVDWQRIWDRGARVADGPKGVVRAMWRPGDRVELDRIDPASGACGPTGVRLQVTVSRAARTTDSVTTSAGFSPTYAGRGGGRGTGQTVASGGSGGAGGRGAAVAAATLLTGEAYRLRIAPRFDAQLWLMHTTPGGKEEAQARTIRFAPAGTGFAFSAEPVQAAFGAANVIVMGTISARMTADDKPSALILTINRMVTGGEPAVPTTSGSTTKEVPWTEATSGVISFELPAAPGAGQDLLPGHRFALRVKVGG